MIANYPHRTAAGYALDKLEAVGLTPRESETLLLIATGKTQREAAAILNCSVSNVKHRLESLFFKLRASRTPELITKAFSSGFLRTLALMLAMHISITGPIIENKNDIATRTVRSQRTQSRTRNTRTRRDKTLWINDDTAIVIA